MKTIVFHPHPPTAGHPSRLRATWPSIHRLALAFLLAGTLSLRAQPAPTEEPAPDTNAEPEAPVEPRTRPGQEIPAPQTNQPPVRRTIPSPPPPAVRQQAPPAFPVPGQPPSLQTPPALQSPVPGQIPGAVVTNAPPSGTNAGAMEEVLDAGIIDFQSADVNSVLEVYAEFVNRTVIRPAQLPGAQIILKTQTALTRQEIIHALDSVLQMNGITMIPVDEKFVKAVPNAQVLQEAAVFYGNDPAGLPETGTYVTHVAQLKYAQPSEVQQILTQFSKVPNGILPVDSSQILVLRDYAANIKRMVEMIEKVDVITPQEFKHKVIPIKYALAEDIANVIGSLSTGGPITVGSSARSGLGGRGTTTQGIGTGTPGVPGQTQQQQQQNIPGGRFGQQAATGQSNFRSNLQRIIRSAAQSGEFQVLGETKIIADARMNALLVFANDHDMEMIEDIISKLDVVQAQVLIETIILDVALSDSFNMGVTMLNRHQSGNLSGTAVSRSGPSLLQTVTNIAGAGGSGFSYFANWSDDLELALNMLASDSKVNVLSRPRIQTSHAEPASLFIGQTRPYVTGAFDTGFGSRTQFQQTKIGTRLDFLPLINQDGLVVLEIRQEVQELGEEVPIDDNFSVPATIDRSAEAKVAVRDGDTIILGGFISTRKDNTRSGVPVLKDIPLLGALFRSTTKEDRRTELMVLIRPTVLPTPEVASLAVQDERSRLPGIRQAEAENRLEHERRQRAADEAIRKMEMEELRRTLGIEK